MKWGGIPRTWGVMVRKGLLRLWNFLCVLKKEKSWGYIKSFQAELGVTGLEIAIIRLIIG